MKILGVTMGKYLQVFLNLHAALEVKGDFDSPAIYTSSSRNFNHAILRHPELDKLELLKEWDLTSIGHHVSPNKEILHNYQKQCSISLWSALLADRRIFFGKLCKSKQDYRSSYSEIEMLGLLQTFLIRIESFIEDTQPDVILSFGSATLGDYVFELMASIKGIPFRQFKSTKINNRIALFSHGTDISTNIVSYYQDN